MVLAGILVKDNYANLGPCYSVDEYRDTYIDQKSR